MSKTAFKNVLIYPSCLRKVDIFDCSIGLLFTANITNFNNYLMYIIKYKYLWYSGLFWSLLWFWARVLLQPVSLFALQVGWLVSARCGFLAGGDFRADSTTLNTFLMLLTLLFNTFWKLQVISFRTFHKRLLLFVFCMLFA